MLRWYFTSAVAHLMLLSLLPSLSFRPGSGTASPERMVEQVRTEKVRYDRRRTSTLRTKLMQMKMIRDDLLEQHELRLQQYGELESQMRKALPQRLSEGGERIIRAQLDMVNDLEQLLGHVREMERLQGEISGHLKTRTYARALENSEWITGEAERARDLEARVIEEGTAILAHLQNYEELSKWFGDEALAEEISSLRQQQKALLDALERQQELLEKKVHTLGRRVSGIRSDVGEWRSAGKLSWWKKKRLESRLKGMSKEELGGKNLEESHGKQQQLRDRLEKIAGRLRELLKRGEFAMPSLDNPISFESARDESGSKEHRQNSRAPGSRGDAGSLARQISEMSEQLNRLYRETRAAELAILQNRTFDSAYNGLMEEHDQAADLAPEQIPEEVASFSDLEQYKESVDIFTQELDLVMADIFSMRKKVLASPTTLSEEGLGEVRTSLREQQQTSQILQNLAGPRGGNIQDLSDEMRAYIYGDAALIGPFSEKDRQPPRLSLFPHYFGRKITSYGRPVEWFYLDSWYLIGPFPNPRRRNLNTAFPPESHVDLDAQYEGKGGRMVRWEFVSSPTFMIVPLHFDDYAIYYGYTELFCEQPQDLWIAVGSDDQSKLWVNDILIWQSRDGVKQWSLNEGFRKVHLKKGINRFLIRLENGWRECGFSVILAPVTGDRSG